MSATPPTTEVALPTLTVITVVFNGAAEIARTIDSVLSQTLQGIEYVIIDGASTDGTQTIVLGYGSSVTTFVSEPDEGVYDAMNKGITRAHGDYLLFMNCGDTFASRHAAAAVMRIAASDKPALVFGGWLRRAGDGRHKSCVPRLIEGIFNHQAVAYRRELHDTHGGYVSVRGFTAADYLFFSSLLARGHLTVKVFDEPIALIDVQGMSAGPQTLSQKYAIDFLHGRTGRFRLAAVLAVHPLWLRLRRWLHIVHR